ncbi:MAG TPA: right-handed parallel beta-helix repeat-containing protein [Candidatus Sulfomarinibacteraceae bacterium]|nr:right-handed parallel beta-helix repeat-containing protein [Candidatus Sulfomarinibacteraceae bacterium]
MASVLRQILTPVAALAVVAVGSPAAAEVLYVPGQVATLSQAVSQVDDGGVIEISAGTYPTPVGGWFFANLGKSFTIRAAAGATVILDGGGARPVFRLQNTTSSLGGQVSFENLVFANGLSTQNGVAGGVTIEANDARFSGCVFRDSESDASVTGGGGAFVFGDADVQFTDCQFLDNRATNEGAGLKVGEGSTVVVHRALFANNRVNLAGHRPSSAGGGIHVGNADLLLSDSRFVGNQAGYVGGGLYAIGQWQSPVTVPRSTVQVANCTFEANEAEPYPGITTPTKTEGGAIHAEDQTLMRIDGCRFILNSAETGGGVNLYRARVEIADSVFRGNRATATGAGTGFGGALSAISNDTSADGSINRPSAELTVADCFIQGSHQGVGSVGQIGGGIYAAGDVNRQYGLSGVSAMPDLATNRTAVTVTGSVLSDLEVVQSVVSTGTGAGMMFDLVDGVLDGNAVLASEAVGTGSQGGAFRAIRQSLVDIQASTFAGNQAQQFGGALYLQGAEVHVDGCALIENTIGGQDYGAAIFSAPDENLGASGVSQTGAISSSVISNTVDRGLLIFDDDRQGSPTTPYNDLRYNANTIFDRTAGSSVYKDPIAGAEMPVSSLNPLVINRIGGTPSTDKVQVANTGPASAPVVADIVAAPKSILPSGAVGDPAGATAAFVGYGWSGGSATLDGTPVSGFSGVSQVGPGTHVLAVGGTQDSVNVVLADEPEASLEAWPIAISSGQSAELAWQTAGGTFVAAVIDQGVSIPSTPSGDIVVWPAVTTTYHLFVLTEEGGATASATVWVDEEPPALFTDGFESGSTSRWSVTQG